MNWPRSLVRFVALWWLAASVSNATAATSPEIAVTALPAIELRWTNAIWRDFSIESSLSLLGGGVWEPLNSGPQGSDGTWSLFDSGGEAVRFYRVVATNTHRR